MHFHTHRPLWPTEPSDCSPPTQGTRPALCQASSQGLCTCCALSRLLFLQVSAQDLIHDYHPLSSFAFFIDYLEIIPLLGLPFIGPGNLTPASLLGCGILQGWACLPNYHTLPTPQNQGKKMTRDTPGPPGMGWPCQTCPAPNLGRSQVPVSKSLCA